MKTYSELTGKQKSIELTAVVLNADRPRPNDQESVGSGFPTTVLENRIRYG